MSTVRHHNEDGVVLYDGVRIYPHFGETMGDAYRRQTKQPPKAKPATEPAYKTDPRVAELKRMESQIAELERCVPLAEEMRRLEAERVQLQQQLDARDKASSRKGFASKLRFAATPKT